jgi:hypothetical protein
MCALTYWAYVRDKRKAVSGEWRISRFGRIFPADPIILNRRSEQTCSWMVLYLENQSRHENEG